MTHSENEFTEQLRSELLLAFSSKDQQKASDLAVIQQLVEQAPVDTEILARSIDFGSQQISRMIIDRLLDEGMIPDQMMTEAAIIARSERLPEIVAAQRETAEPNLALLIGAEEIGDLEFIRTNFDRVVARYPFLAQANPEILNDENRSADDRLVYAARNLLEKAIDTDDLSLMIDILKSDFIFRANIFRESAFKHAFRHDPPNFQVIELLISSFDKVSDDVKGMVFDLAFDGGDKEVINFLLRRYVPYDKLSSGMKKKLVKKFGKEEFDPKQIEDEKLAQSRLAEAISNKDYQMIDQLISDGVEINEVTLGLAEETGDREIVDQILQCSLLEGGVFRNQAELFIFAIINNFFLTIDILLEIQETGLTRTLSNVEIDELIQLLEVLDRPEFVGRLQSLKSA